MTQVDPEALRATVFRYEAQTHEGHALSGELRADTIDEARAALDDANLQIVALEPTRESAKPRPLRGTDFYAFNQQLARLTDAGLPVETGLRLIAEDMRGGRLADAIGGVADDLERGAALPDAFDHHRGRFPAMYGTLIGAGIRTSRLSAVLLNLGRHLEMMQRLRNALYRAGAYPLVVLIAIVLVMAFVGEVVLPQFQEIYTDFDMELPGLTLFVFWLGRWTLPLTIAFFALLVILPVVWWALKRAGMSQAIVDAVFMPLPVVGSALRRNALARWLDVLQLGVDAGLDLPEAIALSGDAIASPVLRRDGRRMVEALESGRDPDRVRGLVLMPATVPAAMQLATERADLGSLLRDLSLMYENQADLRLAAIQSTLGPVFMVGLALLIAFLVVALFLPMVGMMHAVM